MKIFPSKSQFQNWTLPSKASYIGIPLVILIFVIQWFYGQKDLKQGQEEILSSQQKIIEFMEQYTNVHSSLPKYLLKLEESFPLGYTAFHMQDGLVTRQPMKTKSVTWQEMSLDTLPNGCFKGSVFGLKADLPLGGLIRGGEISIRACEEGLFFPGISLGGMTIEFGILILQKNGNTMLGALGIREIETMVR